ncbi:hypothetical protein NXS19_002705 [Fusarium pseudograminearum]|nr:hypothetical protein NXS19_002705 [Fusarium pseudograminearum]
MVHTYGLSFVFSHHGQGPSHAPSSCFFFLFSASPRQAALNWSDRGEGAEAWGKVAYCMSLSLSQSSSAQFSTNIRVVSMRMKILYCGVYMDSTEWDSFGC